MFTVAEIQASFLARTTEPVKTYHPDSTASLVPIWTGATGEFVTMKLRGQLKSLIKKLPAGTAPELLTYAVKHWGDIVYEAEANHAAFKCPDKPQIGFLLKFAHVAVDCKKLADKKATQLIADMEDPNSEEAIKHAYAVKLGFKAAS